MTGRQKTIVMTLGATGAIAVILIALAVARRTLVEKWHLRRLESADKQTRLGAMLALAMIRSQRAVPPLLRIVASEDDEEVGHTAMFALSWMDPEAVIAHLRALITTSEVGEVEVVRRHSRFYLKQLESLKWFDPSAAWPRDPKSLEDFRLILAMWKDFMDKVK